MSTGVELHGHLHDVGDGFVAIKSYRSATYVISVDVHHSDLPTKTLQLLKPGARCRLVLEPEAKDEAGQP